MQKLTAKTASLPIMHRCQSRNWQRNLSHQFYIYIFPLGVYIDCYCATLLSRFEVLLSDPSLYFL